MSNRFYVNDVQIFGNNEMFERTAILYKAIKNDVEYTKGGFVLKEGHKITAEMY